MIKFVFKWLFRLFLLAVVLVVIAVLSVNPLLKALTEKHIRNATGMDAEIGSFSLGLAKPTVTIKNCKVYNPQGYGGTQLLDVREIHAEYDPVALKQHRLHVKLLRVDIAEFDVVKNQIGQTNISSSTRVASLLKAGGVSRATGFLRQNGLKFTGIDELNVSIGKARFIDLEDQQLNRILPIGIENCVIKNVRSPEDLAGLAALVWLHGVHEIGLPVNAPKLGPVTNK